MADTTAKPKEKQKSNGALLRDALTRLTAVEVAHDKLVREHDRLVAGVNGLLVKCHVQAEIIAEFVHLHPGRWRKPVPFGKARYLERVQAQLEESRKARQPKKAPQEDTSPLGVTDTALIDAKRIPADEVARAAKQDAA